VALRRLTQLAAHADMDALQCFAEERQTLSALPDAFMDRLDLALQDLDLEAAQALGEAMLAQLEA
jgi:hypothetical protein